MVGTSLLQVLLVILLGWNVPLVVEAQEKCPDGHPAIVPCNQNSRVCEAEPKLKCIDVAGTFYCCDDGKPSQDDCTDLNPECYKVADTCDSKALRDTLEKQCRKTCKFCTVNTTIAPPTTQRQQPEEGKLHLLLHDLRSAIPSPSSLIDCEDAVQECASVPERCNDESEIVRDTMRSQCKKTCGLCSTEATTRAEPAATTQSQSNAQTTLEPPAVPTTKAAGGEGTTAPGEEATRGETDAPREATTIAGVSDAGVTEDEEETQAPGQGTTVPTENGECRDKNPRCSEVAEQCQTESMRDLMEEECKKTCGFCTTAATQQPQQTTNEASANTQEQTGETGTTIAPGTDQTQATEGTTSKSDCADTNPNCAELNLCDDETELTKELMRETCKKTCGYCDLTDAPTHPVTTPNVPTSTLPTTTLRTTTTTRRQPPTRRPIQTTTTRRPTTLSVCRNRKQQCDMWNKYGFCHTDKIKPAKKKELCGRTCGLC